MTLFFRMLSHQMN